MTAVISPWEAAARMFEPSKPIGACPWRSPGAMAMELDARTVQTSALDLIDDALVDVANGKCLRLMISMAPQEGKSERTSRRFPLWALRRNPDLRIAIVSYAHGVARRWGQFIRDDIVNHGDAIGLSVDPSSSAAHEWKLSGHAGGVYCVGIKGSLTSRAVDLLIVDDPYKDGEQADSQAWQETVQGFWSEVAIPRLGPGVAVVIIQCTVAGMRVLAGNGRWTKIEDVRPGDTVVSLAKDNTTLVTAKVLGRRLSGHDETMTVKTDRLALKVNKRHPFAVLDRGGAARTDAANVKYVQAGDLQPGDVVVTAKSLPADYVADDTLPDGSTVDAERAWLLGYMTGDGWATAHKRKAARAYGGTSYAVCCARTRSTKAHKADVDDRVRAALEAWSPNKVYPTSGGYYRTDWNDGGRLLTEMGFGDGAKNKRVPDCVWSWSPELRRAYIRGYVEADGSLQCTGKRNAGETWRVGSVNADLLHDVRDLALTCGIRPTTVFTDRPRMHQPPNSPEPVECVLSSLGLAFVADLPEGKSFLRRYEHPAPEHLRYEVVRAVEPGLVLPVYDLMVEGTETFVAEGFVTHNTRWRHDDLSGWLQRRDDGVDWRVINIPAQADHRPERGETDPLGREPGEYMVSARGRSVADWEQRRREVGERAWNALFQGRPTPDGGAIFRREWWAAGEYTTLQWVDLPNGSRVAHGFDEIIISWDLAFKATDGCDYVCGQVWGRRGGDAWLLDQVHDRLGFVETCQAIRSLAARWPQATAKLVEDKANGPAVINQLRRTVTGLIPVEPDGSKSARAAAVSPFVEAGNVHVPSVELAPWVDGLIEESVAFPRGRHDDQVDAMTQAINRLLLNPLLADEDIITDPDDDDYTISSI